jgi:hypothetical protein
MASAAGAIWLIHLPMKSLFVSGAGSEAKAFTPPQKAWPSTTIWRTFKARTPNSSAALVPCWPPPSSNGGTRLATLRATRISPGAASKITSGETRESTQPITMMEGDWPLSARVA